MSIYLELTRQFNAGALRAILSSGQAVVLHRLAIMSKDGDWILREEAQQAAKAWQEAWPEVERETAAMPLTRAHAVIVQRAEGLLPHQPAPGGTDARDQG